MMKSDNATKKPLILFVLASGFTFGCITLLQFTPMPWFFLVLIAMHGGIALFIISKKIFKSIDLDVARYYRFQYLLLLPYLFIMVYTFAARAGIIPLFADEKSIFVLSYSACCVIATGCNYLYMKKSLDKQRLNLAATEIGCG